MNIIDPKWIKAEHERQVAALVVMLQAFELISKGQRAAAAKARATLGDIEARDRARTHGYHIGGTQQFAAAQETANSP